MLEMKSFDLLFNYAGTLTQNIMTFNKCSINGRAYGDVIDLRTGDIIEITDVSLNSCTLMSI